MLLSFNWLQDFIKLPKSATPKDIAEKITLHTAEVEDVMSLGKHLENVVVGEILKVKTHPNADKLHVVDVKISAEKTVEIVCGGNNLKDGMKVVVALPGSTITWHGCGEPVTLENTNIRGVDSFGMICASEEVGLEQHFPAKDDKKIMDISFVKDSAGASVKLALGLDDTVF